MYQSAWTKPVYQLILSDNSSGVYAHLYFLNDNKVGDTLG